VLEHERSKLLNVALGADFILRHQFRPAALDHGTLMRVMAISATNFAFENGVMRRQIELGLLVQMALETGFGRLARIDDGASRAAGINVLAARTVTRFAPDVLGVVARCLQMIMAGAAESFVGVFMALFARFRTDVRCAGNLRRNHHRLVSEVGAGNHAKRDHRAEHCEENPMQTTFFRRDNLAENAD